MSLVRGKTNSSPIVWGFLNLAIRIETTYDASTAAPIVIAVVSSLDFVAD